MPHVTNCPTIVVIDFSYLNYLHLSFLLPVLVRHSITMLTDNYDTVTLKWSRPSALPLVVKGGGPYGP